MAVVKIYDPPVLTSGNWTSWADSFRFAASDVVSYEYDEVLDDKGSWGLILPFSGKRLSAISMNSVLCVKDDFGEDWHICENISYDGRQIVLSGHDAKSLLSLRQTIPPQGEDYDKLKNGLGTCVRRLLFHNCTYDSDYGYNLPTKRRLPIRAPTASSVVTTSSFMTAYDDLGNVISELCHNAGVGYRISGGNYNYGFAFNFIVGTDRSYGQTDRARVTFSVKQKNVTTLSFEHSVENLKNCIFAEDPNGTVQTVQRDGVEKAGLLRRECSVDVAADVTEEDYFEACALDAVKDNIETHSYDLSVSAQSGYGSKYFLGDIVTVRDDFTGSVYNGQITGVGKSFSAGQRLLRLTIGKPKQKLLDRIVKNLKNGVI